MFWGSILNHSSFVNRGHMSWIFRFLDFFCRQMWFLDFFGEIFTPRTHAYTRTRMRTHARTHKHTRIHATQIHTCEHTQQIHTAVNAETHNILFCFLSIMLCFSCSAHLYWKNRTSSTVWKFSKILAECFLNISTPRKTFPYYGIGQNYRKWILQPLSIIFPYYEEV